MMAMMVTTTMTMMMVMTATNYFSLWKRIAPQHFDNSTITLTCLHTVNYRFNMPSTTTNRDFRMHVVSPHHHELWTSNSPIKSPVKSAHISQISQSNNHAHTLASVKSTYSHTHISQSQIRTHTLVCSHQSKHFVKILYRISHHFTLHTSYVVLVYFYFSTPYQAPELPYCTWLTTVVILTYVIIKINNHFKRMKFVVNCENLASTCQLIIF